MSVTLSGGSTPFYLNGTQNCAKCCSGPTDPGDFDVSYDMGVTFVNATVPTIVTDITVAAQLSDVADGAAHERIGEGAARTTTTTIGTIIKISVATPSRPTHVRYTANQGFPQCAVYNAEGFPLYPFSLAITGVSSLARSRSPSFVHANTSSYCFFKSTH